MWFKEFSALPFLNFLFLTWTYSLLARVLWRWNYIFKSTEFSDTILCAGHKAISPGTMIEGFNAPPISVQSILCFPSACLPFPYCFIVIYFCSLRSTCWRILMGEWVLWKRYILIDFFFFHDSTTKNNCKATHEKNPGIRYHCAEYKSPKRQPYVWLYNMQQKCLHIIRCWCYGCHS